MRIGSIENHRGREEGAMIYPVYSRRSQGISLGINLFPDQKFCSFNCPYCEIFPFKTNLRFSLERMERELQQELFDLKTQEFMVKDLCFSGNGEPTLSPYFSQALTAVSRIRDAWIPEAALVVITNGTGLLEKPIFNLLSHAAAGPMGLQIWLKLDAGTENWYQEMHRSSVSYHALVGRIKALVKIAPVTIQTMLCKVKGQAPSPEEAQAWEALVLELTQTNTARTGIKDIQIYGKARAAPEDPLAEVLSLSYLEDRAESLKKTLEPAGLHPRIQVFP